MQEDAQGQAAWISGAEEIFVAVLVDRDCHPVLRYNTLRRDLQGSGRLVPTSISQNRDISPPSPETHQFWNKALLVRLALADT